MTAAEASAPIREASWYGWVLAFAFVLAPVAGWVGPLAFAPIVGLSGLLSLGALRMVERDRPAALAILVLSIWALVSMVWSPFHPTKAGQATAMKLILQGVLYWALFRAGAALPSSSRVLVLRIFAWGMALLGALLAIEALTGAGVYQALRNAMGDPIRPDLAVKNVAQGGFVLAVLTPAAALAGWRVGVGVWPGLLMAAGVLGASFGLDADAPVIALVLSALAVWAVWRWPIWAPRVLGAGAAVLFLAAPAVVWATRQLGWFQALEREVPLSWSLRMGYWRHAADWIGDHPLRGWGIDASRMFGPGITLHPHNGPLQVWLELGLIGATAAAVFWFVAIASQSQPHRDVGRGAAVGTAVAYLTFSAVSFGVWQEWWLAVGGLAAAGCMAVLRQGRAENA